ncbi:methyl-accepting chemotaxis protein [Paenalcaligenes niemegkensis]|uniref:methyl-accepting chemotaxis protein n=1 Tax=Paenalcaligenes niemegkensis TaxID=2895469 RepID=UPI001EE829CD|nr:methyl-accepting chemotaxis protein [Paenalcaligenes niemegkensis]MCQ9616578.1 methyl-accepting chemotaxis protein [Paenalcaligenes niemegkensis]
MKQHLTLKSGFIGYFILLALFSLLIFGALRHLTTTIDHLQQSEQARYRATQLANDFSKIVDSMSRNVMAFVSSEQPEFEADYLSLLEQLRGNDQSPSLLKRFESGGFTSDEHELLSNAYAQAIALSDTQLEAISTASGQFDDGQGGIRVALPNRLMAQVLVFSQQYAERSTEIASTIQQFDVLQSNRLSQQVNDARAASTRAYLLALLALASLMVVSAVGLIALYRSIKAPLNQGVQLAKQLASGQLDARIQHDRGDEIGALLVALNGIGEGLNHTISNVQDRAHQIHDASTLHTQTNQSLASHIQDQSSQLVHATDRITKLSEAINANSSYATDAHELTRQSELHAQEGEVAMQQMLGTMQEIHQGSKQMGSITELIRNIAFQTNILALNAAVEAAQAGNHGRGFAVVATEVRQLALRSSQASSDIEKLISRSDQRIAQGMDAAKQTEALMTEIHRSVQSVRILMNDISQATSDQGVDAEMLRTAMQELELLSQQNLELVDAATLSTKQQLSHVEGLAQIVHLFTLNTDGSDTDGTQTVAVHKSLSPLALATSLHAA